MHAMRSNPALISTSVAARPASRFGIVTPSTSNPEMRSTATTGRPIPRRGSRSVLREAGAMMTPAMFSEIAICRNPASHSTRSSELQSTTE